MLWDCDCRPSDGVYLSLRVSSAPAPINTFAGKRSTHATGRIHPCCKRPLPAQSDCPSYVHRRVWDQAAIPVRSSSVYKLVAASTPSAASSSSSAASAAPPSSASSSSSSTTTASSAAPSYPDYVVKSGSPGGSFDRDDDDNDDERRHHTGGRPAGAAAAAGGRGGRGAGEWQGKAANPLATTESLTMEDVTLIR